MVHVRDVVQLYSVRHSGDMARIRDTAPAFAGASLFLRRGMTNKPIYVVDHYKVAGGKLEGGDSLTFNAENDSDAWQKANEWSASSSWVLFQATHLRLRRDGKLIKKRSLGASSDA
jgi:hypothetical protein